MKLRRARRGRLRVPRTARGWRQAALVLVLALLVGTWGFSVTGRGGERRGSGSGGDSGRRDWSGTVVWVSDGDTLGVVPQAGGRPRKIRLDGIDAPESCQQFGREAGDALRRRVLRQQVQVATRGRDSYQRLLAKIRLDGEDIGAWMVAQGNAWSYRYRNNPGPYAAQEQRARHARLGLFAQPAPQNPRDFRKSHGPCG